MLDVYANWFLNIERAFREVNEWISSDGRPDAQYLGPADMDIFFDLFTYAFEAIAEHDLVPVTADMVDKLYDPVPSAANLWWPSKFWMLRPVRMAFHAPVNAFQSNSMLK